MKRLSALIGVASVAVAFALLAFAATAGLFVTKTPTTVWDFNYLKHDANVSMTVVDYDSANQIIVIDAALRKNATMNKYSSLTVKNTSATSKAVSLGTCKDATCSSKDKDAGNIASSKDGTYSATDGVIVLGSGIDAKNLPLRYKLDLSGLKKINGTIISFGNATESIQITVAGDDIVVQTMDSSGLMFNGTLHQPWGAFGEFRTWGSAQSMTAASYNGPWFTNGVADYIGNGGSGVTCTNLEVPNSLFYDVQCQHTTGPGTGYWRYRFYAGSPIIWSNFSAVGGGSLYAPTCFIKDKFTNYFYDGSE